VDGVVVEDEREPSLDGISGADLVAEGEELDPVLRSSTVLLSRSSPTSSAARRWRTPCGRV
jgi:hypothetical protein